MTNFVLAGVGSRKLLWAGHGGHLVFYIVPGFVLVIDVPMTLPWLGHGMYLVFYVVTGQKDGPKDRESIYSCIHWMYLWFLPLNIVLNIVPG
ncbi:MAG: hypothetical protein KJ638_05185 [Chloroflexi bacterium]|nr:hypothetical protein [Chloroflexota bacterium]